MAIQEKFKKVLRKSQLISLGDRVLVAVSGGPDSVALLHVLCNLQDELGLHLEVAHLEHGMRGAEAKGDARFVRELAERLAGHDVASLIDPLRAGQAARWRPGSSCAPRTT